MPAFASAFIQDVSVAKTCPAEGEILWYKDWAGANVYSLCYAPSLEAGNPGPTGGHLRCDDQSYFMVENPRYCCKNARIDYHGKKMYAQHEVCGDLLATFDQDQQRLKIIGGPTSTGTSEQLQQLDQSGFGDITPSPIAMTDMKKEAGHWVSQVDSVCRGKLGTMINWEHSMPPDKAEMCPTGTKPVSGPGYKSWMCDGHVTKEQQLHCCNVHGEMRCVPNLVDMTQQSSCKCPGVGGDMDFHDTEAAIPVPLLFLPPPIAVLYGRQCSRYRQSKAFHARCHGAHSFL